ncbi:MAG: ScyD/ScyE family protein [Gammaproteobacteria bacterium]|nr:ScyD/ScyE family protein [Gammaproteobacteria bacterium]
MKRSQWIATGLGIAGAWALGSVALAETQVAVIAQGLSNPRGLNFAPNGSLFVAEAGTGGTGGCLPSPEDPTQQRCYGETGALTRIDPTGVAAPRRVVQGLPSMAGPGGFAASSGPVDVDFFGMSAFVVMGWGGDPALRQGVGSKSALFGTVLRVLPHGGYLPVADVARNESRFNPAGGPVDSNPYGILALPGRRVIADAGANALIEARGWWDCLHAGNDRTLAVLPPTPAQLEPVPTSVVQGPDGFLYVGQLTGAPFLRGTASIYRVPPHGGPAQVYLSGLTAIVDLAFDRSGNLYVLEIARGLVPGPEADPGVGAGRLLRKRPGEAPEVVLDNLVFPGGVAVGPDDALYLTNFGIFPDAGQVLRVTLD